jgi:hypothetical protein
MSNFTSFNTYEAPREDSHQAPVESRVNADAGMTTRVIVRDGVSTVEQTSSRGITGAELNPYHGTDTVFETAKGKHGIGLKEITDETLLTINGVQATAKFFKAEGFIHQTADGQWVEGSGEPEAAPQAAPVEDISDNLSMPLEVAEAVDNALDGVAHHQIDPLLATGVAVATGQVDIATLTRKLSEWSGATPAEAANRIATMQQAYQMQVDAAITSRTPVSAADLPDLYAWAKKAAPAELRGAIQGQIRGNDFSGFRALADRYLASNPPSVNAVQAAGIEVRTEGKVAEVFLEGRWITLPTAARLGMI